MRPAVGLLGAVLLWAGVASSLAGEALDLPPLARQALELELAGRWSESLDLYLTALASTPSLSGDEGVRRPDTVFVLHKAAQLAVDLGRGEQAWDLAGRLLASDLPEPSALGTAVRMRVWRLNGRLAEARGLWLEWRERFPRGVMPFVLAREASQSGAEVAASSAFDAWMPLPTPGDVGGLEVLATVRLQLGAFQDWNRALTLVDVLREKGWIPITEVRKTAEGIPLHVVSILSRQAEADRARLAAEGLLPIGP